MKQNHAVQAKQEIRSNTEGEGLRQKRKDKGGVDTQRKRIRERERNIERVGERVKKKKWYVQKEHFNLSPFISCQDRQNISGEYFKSNMIDAHITTLKSLKQYRIGVQDVRQKAPLILKHLHGPRGHQRFWRWRGAVSDLPCPMACGSGGGSGGAGSRRALNNENWFKLRSFGFLMDDTEEYSCRGSGDLNMALIKGPSIM